MAEFIGQTGTVIAEQLDGQTKLYRVELDSPVEVEGLGRVADDLWARPYLKPIRT